MVNDCIRVGLQFEEENHATPSMKKLSLLCYSQLKKYEARSTFRLAAISKAAGILSARRKSIKIGVFTKSSYVSKPLLVSCYDVKVQDGKLRVQLRDGSCEYIPLNTHTLRILSDAKQRINSFTLTATSLSICISREIEAEPGEFINTVGIDRNLRNLTVGNEKKVTYYDMRKVVEIAENTRSIVGSFKRNDVRMLQSISSKYGKRRRERTKQLIHGVTKQIVQEAKANRRAIIFEEIRGIRNLYRKGNGQGKSFRDRMNSWPFHEVKRQIEYKAAWEGVPVITLSRKDTRGTTMDCPRCGERLQVPIRGDAEHYHQPWCKKCERWMDRDLVAVLNISRRGRVRFARSSTEGEAGEAVKRNAERDGEPLIRRVDASK
ncbi:MAG TPA: transposase, partial [Nitrososphaerales archaeon]|nr:transposase [Nitrososphaerales archaeon]